MVSRGQEELSRLATKVTAEDDGLAAPVGWLAAAQGERDLLREGDLNATTCFC